MYNKLKEKYQRCQQEAQQLLVENHKINENLRNENEKAKQNAAEYEQLNTVLLDLRKQHIEEKEDLKEFFDKQQSENDIQHQKHVDRLLEEIQKCKDDLVQNKENQNMQGGTVTHNIDLTCHNLQKEIDRLEKDNKTLREELEFERRHVQKKEDDFKNIRSEIQTIMEEKELEINSLKVKYEKHQLAGREVLNKNERLLLDTDNLRVALQQEIAKAKTLENERDLVREELQQVKGEQFETMQKLKVVDDIQRKVSNANQELKEEMSLLRLENIKIKTELTSQQENARTHDAKEHEFDNQHKILREEIHKAKQQNEQLHLDNRKLNVQLHQEKDNVTKYKRELDIKSNEIQKLKQQQEEMYRKTMKLSEDLSQQQDNAKQQEESKSKLIKDIKILQEQLHQIQNENEHLLKELNSVQEVEKVQDDHRTKIISYQEIISKQIKEISCLKTEIDKQKAVHNNKLKKVHQHVNETNKLPEQLQQIQNENKHLLEEFNSKENNDNDNKLWEFHQIVHGTIEKTEVLIRETENAKLAIETYVKHILLKQTIFETQKNEFAPTDSTNKCVDVEDRNGKPNADSRPEDRNMTVKETHHQLTQLLDTLKNAQREFDDTKSRFSRVMEDRFIENNPVKDDISDPNCPTRISQRYQDLYENQWADAYEIVDRSAGSEAKTIETLISILTETMVFCTTKSVHQMASLSETLSKGNDLSASTLRQLKDVRKSSAESYGKGLYMVSI